MTYDNRASEIKAFDETKAGVKGLVDAGVTQIPRFFIHPSILHDDSSDPPVPYSCPEIPIIDLGGTERDPSRRNEIVGEVGRASARYGFFQVVNHGIPRELLDEMREGVRMFNEEPGEVKMEYYTRDQGRKVIFNSNFDLYQAPAANWRDTMFVKMAPEPPAPEDLPLACRDMTIKFSGYVQILGNLLFELLSEALGLDRYHLKEMECAKGFNVASHYYPPCPEPQLTLGATKHSDPSFLTILLQDHIGGLQILHQNQWIDVAPLPGALVINIGDLLQLISNDKLKSVEHRVLANKVGPRISVACFFTSNLYPSSRLYGPIKELLSDESPPKYKEILVKDFTAYYNGKGLDGRSALDYFKL